MILWDWYTDFVDVWRVVESKDGALTVQERQKVIEGVPCRIYRTDKAPVTMQQQAAYVKQSEKLACDNAVDIRAGDELIIHRGGRIGAAGPTIRAFAGDPAQYYEPFGAVIPGLAHQEISLLQEERVDGLESDRESQST